MNLCCFNGNLETPVNTNYFVPFMGTYTVNNLSQQIWSRTEERSHSLEEHGQAHSDNLHVIVMKMI